MLKLICLIQKFSTKYKIKHNKELEHIYQKIKTIYHFQQLISIQFFSFFKFKAISDFYFIIIGNQYKA